jgi:formamidopyrimidine-DNA glycosylase
MTGRIVLHDTAPHPLYDRFSVDLEDGGRFALRDKRRLGRAVLNPDFSHVGPDAAEVDRDTFRRVIGSGRVPIKARLHDQGAIAGVGNLLADEALWRARLSPERPAGSLPLQELDRLRREIRFAVRSAIRRGGAHTGDFIPARDPAGACPRCGSGVARTRLGGRTTYWCPSCQG